MSERHARTLAINTLARMLTALMERPARLVYLSSGLHRGGESSLDHFDRRSASYGIDHQIDLPFYVGQIKDGVAAKVATCDVSGCR